MKRISLALCLFMASQNALADLCSESNPGVPCMPDPGEETTQAKKKILRLISLAARVEPEVKRLEANYRTVRNDPNASDEEKFEACEPYRKAKLAQDRLYKEAMNKTSELYHARPHDTGPLVIGVPSDPAISYVAGLSAVWDPQVTDSGPGVKLAVKVIGLDGQARYAGAVSMNPDRPGGYKAITIEDGRVLILKGVFNRALKDNNPGVLASVLYHEARHFNRLSREVDGSATALGWTSIEEEELGAYNGEVITAKFFGLTTAQTDELIALRQENRDKLNRGKRSSRAIDPHQEALWRDYYETHQINLEDEYAALKITVDAARREQAEVYKRELEVKPTMQPFVSRDPEGIKRRLEELKRVPGSKSPSEVAAARAAGPRPLSEILPTLKEFSEAACLAPGRLPDGAIFYNSFDLKYRAYDDAQIQSLSAGMGGCALHLFNKFIERTRLNSGMLDIDGKWTKETIGRYLRSQQPPTYEVIPNTGRGQRNEEPGCSPQNGVYGCPK